MIEKWKDIPGYDGRYQASTEGNIRRVLKSGQFRNMTPYHKKNERESAPDCETHERRKSERGDSSLPDRKDVFRACS